MKRNQFGWVWESLLLIALAMVAARVSLAGTVRTAYSGPQQMTPIFLKLGQSTVVRFNEKPKKVVIGNQNYFNVEFIEKDITIQPLGQFSTNLFVYCENHTYGFLLKFDGPKYDDLVQVKWQGIQPTFQTPARELPPTKVSLPNITGKVGKSLLVKVKKLQGPTVFGVHIIDLEIENITGSEINAKNIQLFRIKGNVANPLEPVFELEKLAAKSKTRARLILKLSSRENCELRIKYSGDEAKILISSRFL